MAKRETLFSVRDRSLILKALHSAGAWEGSRKGFMVHFTLDRHAPKGQELAWGVCINRRWIQDTTSTVFDAVQCIEQKVNNKEWDARVEKLAAMEEEEA